MDARGEVIAVRGNLDLDDLTLDVEGEEVESVHHVDDCADENRREDGESVETGAAGHADAHHEEDEADVPGLLDRIPESHHRQGTHQGERPGDVRAHDEHDERDEHAEDDESLHVALAVADVLVGRPVDPGDDEAAREGEQKREQHVHDTECAGEVGEAEVQIHLSGFLFFSAVS